MPNELSALRLDQYRPSELAIDCARCRRRAHVDTSVLAKKFGRDVTLGELARRVAAAGNPRCALVEVGHCSVRPVEPEFHLWAKLDDARRLGYGARLYCMRRLVALKRARSCPQVVDLDVDTLIAAFQYDFPLDRLPNRLHCPSCGTRSIHIDWIAPAERPTPGGDAAATGKAVQLRTAAGRGRFRVIGD